VSAENRIRATAVLQDLSSVSYERAGKEIKQALGAKNKVDELRMANALADQLRAQYRRAADVARGGGS